MCVHLWVAVTASLRFVLKLLRQHAFSKQSGNRVCVCVCAFMGCCDSIPQVCFKVAATARFFKTKCCCGFVCVCAFMGCCDSIPQVCFKVAATAHFFKTSCNRVCVCVHLWVAVTASFKLKASMFFFRFWVRSLPLWRCDSII